MTSDTSSNEDADTTSTATQAEDVIVSVAHHRTTTSTDATATVTTSGTSARKHQRGQNAVRAMLEANGSVYSVADFLKMYVPSLPPLESLLESMGIVTTLVEAQEEPSLNHQGGNSRAELHLLLKETLLTTPNKDDILPLTKLRIPTCCSQSLSSLIQDCIWTLVQRRDSNRQNGRKQFNKHNNLLCQGYAVVEHQGFGFGCFTKNIPSKV